MQNRYSPYTSPVEIETFNSLLSPIVTEAYRNRLPHYMQLAGALRLRALTEYRDGKNVADCMREAHLFGISDFELTPATYDSLYEIFLHYSHPLIQNRGEHGENPTAPVNPGMFFTPQSESMVHKMLQEQKRLIPDLSMEELFLFRAAAIFSLSGFHTQRLEIHEPTVKLMLQARGLNVTDINGMNMSRNLSEIWQSLHSSNQRIEQR